jgi:hypothetical protein
MTVHHNRHEARELHKKQQALVQKRLNLGFGAVVLAALAALLAIAVVGWRLKTVALAPLAAAGYFVRLFFLVLPAQIRDLQSQIDQKSPRA